MADETDPQMTRLRHSLDEVANEIDGVSEGLESSSVSGGELAQILERLRDAHAAVEESRQRLEEALEGSKDLEPGGDAPTRELG